MAHLTQRELEERSKERRAIEAKYSAMNQRLIYQARRYLDPFFVNPNRFPGGLDMVVMEGTLRDLTNTGPSLYNQYNLLNPNNMIQRLFMYTIQTRNSFWDDEDWVRRNMVTHQTESACNEIDSDARKLIWSAS